MAAWQVGFYVVPRRALGASGALTPSLLANTNWWADHAFPADYQTRLAVVASARASAHAGVETWGSDDGNRVDVSSNVGRVTKMTARVDVRRLDSRFGAALLDFVRKAGAVLIRSDCLIVEPIIAAYAGALRNSEAWRFANAPAILSATSTDDEDDE